MSFGKKISAVETTNKSALARELKVSRSSLYYRPKKPDKDEALRREIERVMLKNSQGIPDFQAPPPIPRFVDTSEAVDELPSYDAFEPCPDDC